MKNIWLLVVIVGLGLGGCAGLNQFPQVSPNPERALHELDGGYEHALVQIYGSDGDQPQASAEQQKRIRNKLIETRMALIDAHYREFEAGLVKENVRTELGIALLGVSVGAAGALVTETASQILSAVSGGLAGAQAAYGKAVLYDKAMASLLAQMRANRKVMAAQIFQRWTLDLEQYPLWLARTDLEAYYFAGSLPGAILGTAADAKTKGDQADMILLRAVTPVSASKRMFDARLELENVIDGLDVTKAKALVAKVETVFPEIKPFIDAQYTSATRAADTDSSKAKTVLKRAIVLTVRDLEDAGKWQSVIGGL